MNHPWVVRPITDFPAVGDGPVVRRVPTPEGTMADVELVHEVRVDRGREVVDREALLLTVAGSASLLVDGEDVPVRVDDFLHLDAGTAFEWTVDGDDGWEVIRVSPPATGGGGS